MPGANQRLIVRPRVPIRERPRGLAALTRWLIALVGLVGVGAATPAITLAGGPLVDRCVGIDHPPFTRPYAGDGLSYIVIGTSADGPIEMLIIVDFLGASTERRQTWGPTPGTMLEAFPIYDYGTYAWRIMTADGTVLDAGDLEVGPGEVDCDPAALATAAPESAPPSAAPTTAPSPSAPPTSGPSQAPTPSPSAAATPTAPGTSAPPVGGGVTGSLDPLWLVLIVLGVLLALVGLLVLFFGIDLAGTTSCPDQCDTVGAKRNCALTAFGISSQGRNPDNDAGIDLAIKMLRHAPLPGMGTGIPTTIGRVALTGTAPATPLPATPSGAAREPVLDMTTALRDHLNNRFPQLWIKITYDECITARCVPQFWRTYRKWRRTTSDWIQVREATPAIADPMGVFPRVSEWTKPDILRLVNQAIVDTVNAQGCG